MKKVITKHYIIIQDNQNSNYIIIVHDNQNSNVSQLQTPSKIVVNASYSHPKNIDKMACTSIF